MHRDFKEGIMSLEIGQSQDFFGCTIELIEGGHAVITYPDNYTLSFYEMQYAKDIAFGGDVWAIEVFPAHRDLVDGQNQRHLWEVDPNSIPKFVRKDGSFSAFPKTGL